MISEESIQENFDVIIRPYVECLLSHRADSLDITSDPLQLVQPFTGCINPDEKDAHSCDRFTLKIPYAQQTLTWEVVFDASNIKESPDFIFDPEDDDFHPPLADINSLVCWDWQNRESLVAVVTELLEHYRAFQLERASRSPPLQGHLQSLMSVLDSPGGLQLVVNRAQKGLGATNCLVKIQVDFSKIPPYLMQGDTGEATAVLHICIPYPESSSAQAQLFLSPSLESAFEGSASLRIPTFQHGMLMGDYFERVKLLLEKQVKLISEGFEKRKDYIAAFVNHFGKSVLEYDIQSFKHIVLLWEWNDFFFTFTVELPVYFPSEHPSYTLRSVYHSQARRPYTEKFTDVPYSPRWTGNEMAKRASDFVMERIKDFQKASVTQSDR